MFEFFLFFFFLLFLFLQTSRQRSLNRDVIFKMSFRKACFRFINDPTIHLRLRKGNKNTVFNNLRGRVTRKVCLTSWRDFSDYAISRLLFPFFFLLLLLFSYMSRDEHSSKCLREFKFSGFSWTRENCIASRKSFENKPKAFYLFWTFQRWRHNSRDEMSLCVKRVYACLNERRSKKWLGIGNSKILNNLVYTEIFPSFSLS